MSLLLYISALMRTDVIGSSRGEAMSERSLPSPKSASTAFLARCGRGKAKLKGGP